MGCDVTRKPKPTEAQVARAAETWLRLEGFDIYREVSDGYAGARADLVGRRGRTVHVVETKTRLSLDLIDQAAAWIGRAEQVSVCVPDRAGTYDRLPIVVLRQLGVGLLEARSLEGAWANAVVGLPARWHRVRGPDRRGRDPVLSLLRDEQRTQGEAGTNLGGYATPFRRTMHAVAEHVRANPGCTIRDVVAAVEHHYPTEKSARACVARAIVDKLCPGVVWDVEHRCWPAPAEAAS